MRKSNIRCEETKNEDSKKQIFDAKKLRFEKANIRWEEAKKQIFDAKNEDLKKQIFDAKNEDSKSKYTTRRAKM